jgi:hypothetical protein
MFVPSSSNKKAVQEYYLHMMRRKIFARQQCSYSVDAKFSIFLQGRNSIYFHGLLFFIFEDDIKFFQQLQLHFLHAPATVFCAGILEQAMGARDRVGTELMTDTPAYVAWRNRLF